MIGRIATITADLGAEAPLDCVTLLSTMRGAVAMVQARLSNVANFSATLADTGLLKAEAPNQRRDMLRRLDAARDTLERAAFTWVHATRSNSLFFEHLHAFR